MFEENEDDPDEVEQLEFSGVSGSITSSLSSQQSQQAPPPPPPPPLPPPVRRVTRASIPSTEAAAESAQAAVLPKTFKCPICKRTLKTLVGFNNHVSNIHGATHLVISPNQSAGEAVHVPAVSEGGITRVFTPSAVSSGLPTVASGSGLASQPPMKYTCEECKAELSTKSGFLRHRATHILKDVNKKKPSSNEFKENALPAIMDEIIQELSSEPSFAQTTNFKIKFIEEFQCKKGSPEYLEFVMMLADFISPLFCERQTKILPMNQYEEAQKSLNEFLNINGSTLKEKLLAVCELQVSPTLAARLVFRIATKILQKGQSWVISKMRNQIVERPSRHEEESQMSKAEEGAFIDILGGVLREYFKKAVRKTEGQGQQEGRCIKETFIDGQHPLSREQFLDKSLWLSGEDDCITVSDNALSFFKSVELDIISSLESITVLGVLERVLERSDLLDCWYHLTNAYFSEENSLTFMGDLLSCFIKKSSLLKEKKNNRAEERTLQATAAPLRGHLQRNYVEKDQDDGTENVA